MKMLYQGHGTTSCWHGQMTDAFMKIDENGKQIRNGIRKGKKIMLEEIKELVAETLGTDVEELTEETSFSEDLNADSLDLFEMVMELEDKFDVKIPTEDLEQIKTIGDVKKYIEEQ